MGRAGQRRWPGRRASAVAALACLGVLGGLLTVPASAAAPRVPSAVPPRLSVPTTFTFSGAGVGHGVGMSQYGALGMARDGYSTDQILTHYYTGTTVAPVSDDVQLRVSLLHQVSSAAFRTEPLVTGGGTLEIALAGRPVVRSAPLTAYRLARSAGGVTVTAVPANGPAVVVGTGPSLALRWSGTAVPGGTGTLPSVLDLAGSVGALAGSGHRYRYGWVEVTPSALTTTGLEVVNVVRLHDDYLLGIGEVPSSWPVAALQAQVVAARSYALARYGTGAMLGSCRCQLDSGHGPFWDQNFVGYTKVTGAGGARWAAAVQATDASATTGQAVLYRGVPVQAFYGAATGGRTQSSQDVWGSALPWAQSVDDHWSLDPSITAWAAWNPRVRTQAQVAAAFGLPDVLTLDLSARLVSGALATATATSSTGARAVLRGSVFASRLSLPSAWVWRAASTVSADAVTAALVAAQAGPAGRAVVLAGADAAATVDAAVAAAYASAASLPYLLTPRTGLPAAVRAELVRRKVTTVYAVGTADELPAAVVTALQAMKIAVVRLTGADPSAVSVAVARLLARPAGTPAVVVSAAEPALVVSAAAAAGVLRRPLLVLPPAATAVPAGVTAYLTAARVTSTLLVALPAFVPDPVGLALPGVRRISGVDDADASAWLDLVAVPPGASSTVELVTPTVGLRAGLAAAATGTPVLVVGASLSTTATALLRTARISTVVSSAAVPAAVVWTVRRA
jgi:SpoIID/LytB domain protein